MAPHLPNEETMAYVSCLVRKFLARWPSSNLPSACLLECILLNSPSVLSVAIYLIVASAEQR